jgi:hypothetical protein
MVGSQRGLGLAKNLDDFDVIACHRDSLNELERIRRVRRRER